MGADYSGFKVSCQSASGRDTTGHNDRTMYKDGYSNPLAVDDGIPNYHWSQEEFGMTSTEREHALYEALFMDEIERINENYRKQRKWDRYRDLDDKKKGEKNRYRAVEDFRKTRGRQPQETIFQIGNKDKQLPREEAKRLLQKQVEYMVSLDESCGNNFHLISADIHMDEATPHMHCRYLLLDDAGKINKEGALEALDIEPPKDYSTTKAGKAERNNNRLMTFTAGMREDFEEMLEEEGIEINTSRTRRRHRSIRQYQADEKRKDEEKKAEEEAKKKIEEIEEETRATKAGYEAQVQEAKDELARVEEEVERRKTYNELMKEIADAKQKLFTLPKVGAPAYDQQGKVINQEWLDNTLRDIDNAPIRPSKKKRLRDEGEVMQAILDEPEPPELNRDALNSLQANFDRAQKMKKEEEQRRRNKRRKQYFQPPTPTEGKEGNDGNGFGFK